jgi:putative ABC transport system substrate-binding protein
MRRRELITILGGAATVWPFVTFAQPAVPIIGFLSSRSPADTTTLVAAFRNGLGEAGYIEGKNITVEYRWADGQYDRLPALVADLVHEE